MERGKIFIITISCEYLSPEILKYFHFSQSYICFNDISVCYDINYKRQFIFTVTKNVAKMHIHITSFSNTRSKNVTFVCKYDSQSYTFILHCKSQFVYHLHFPENQHLTFSSFGDPLKIAYHSVRYQRAITFIRNTNSFS